MKGLLAILLLVPLCQGSSMKGPSMSGDDKNYLAPSYRERWPNNELVYYIDPGYTPDQAALFVQAMQYIAQRSCVTFRAKDDDDEAYLHIRGDQEICNCEQGYTGGVRTMNMAFDYCLEMQNLIHEFLHALGAHHEHQRPDRDASIRINWPNIQPDYQFTFQRAADVNESPRPPLCYLLPGPPYDDCYDGNIAETFGLPFDFASIMLYPPTSASISWDLTTMDAWDGTEWGINYDMSDLDVQKLNAAYDSCPPDFCIDFSVNCEYWADNGYCQSDPAYMLENCRLSCQVC